MKDRADTKNDNLYIPMLSNVRNGASKTQLAELLSMYEQQLRLLAAELVDKGILHLDTKSGMLITSDKGLLFLRSHGMK